MATKRIEIKKSNGTSDVFNLVIPDKRGTYNIKFKQSDGGVLDAGNIEVDGRGKKYKITFGLSNGGTIDAGVFSTPLFSEWRTIWDYEDEINDFQKIFLSGFRPTERVEGLRANVPTRITFSGTLVPNGFATNHDFRVYNSEQSDNGVYTFHDSHFGEDAYGLFGDYTYGFTLRMENGYASFAPYIEGTIANPCEEDVFEATLDLQNTFVGISKIEQYY